MRFRDQFQPTVQCLCAGCWVALRWRHLVHGKQDNWCHPSLWARLHNSTTVSSSAFSLYLSAAFGLKNKCEINRVHVETPALIKHSQASHPVALPHLTLSPICLFSTGSGSKMVLKKAYIWSFCWRSPSWGRKISMSTTRVKRRVAVAILKHILLC